MENRVTPKNKLKWHSYIIIIKKFDTKRAAKVALDSIFINSYPKDMDTIALNTNKSIFDERKVKWMQKNASNHSLTCIWEQNIFSFCVINSIAMLCFFQYLFKHLAKLDLIFDHMFVHRLQSGVKHIR